MTKSDEIIAKYNSGVSVINLAKEYNLTRERIYQYLRKAPNFKGISSQKREEKVKKRLAGYSHLLPAIFEMREQGLGTTTIASKLGITYNTTRTLLKGTQWDNSKKVKALRNRSINRAYLNGMSQVKIAKKFGMCQSSISAILLKTNNGQLPKRPRNRG